MQRRTRSRARDASVAALAALLVGAAALRVVGIRYGLPFPLLNPDEQSIVPRAWAVAQGGGLDPGWYDYPSLLIYLLAPFQAWHDEPSYLAARLVVAALGVGSVAAAWWLGRTAYGAAAGWVAGAATAVATVHVAYSHVAVTDVALALGVTASLALMVTGRLELAGLAAGLATSAKYPGAFLAVPLLVAAWPQWRRLAAAGGLALAAFALTSPFVLLNAGEALEDVRRVQRLARAGWLGFEHDHPTPLAFADRLWESLGPFLVVAAAGLAVAAVRRRRADLVLCAFVLVYFADLLTLDAHFDRYVLPLVAPLGALAGRLRPLAPLALALLVVPLGWSIRDDARLLREDTRVTARAWIERHLPRGARVAADPSAPPLDGLDGLAVTRLELPGPGRATDARRDVERLRASGVRYVVVSGAVADRVRAASERYPHETRFYDELERRTRLLYRREARGGLTGPWVAVYRL